MTTLAEKIAVMQAAERGEKIEWRPVASAVWGPIIHPTWHWGEYDYRVAPRKLKIWVCEWPTSPGKVWVTENNPKTRHDAQALRILSEQTITY
jgi:hypothetical protein